MSRAEFVDILCIGSGSAGLAAGIAEADAGLKVLVVELNREVASPTRQVGASVESWTTLLQRRWGVDEFNSSTNNYLEELTSSLGPPAHGKVSRQLPIGTVETFADVKVDPTQAVPPFHGADLAKWARECLTSPFGLMLSRVSSPRLTPMRKVDGPTIRAGRIAPVPTSRSRDMTVRQWLSELAREKGVTVQESCAVQRLIFHDGQLVGAVFDTPEGARTVRARRGVVLGTSCSAGDDALSMSPMAPGGGTTLCLVGRPASRFARLEFLRSAASYSQCAAPGRLA
jgi:choline dehydrogenase-like flavoprotein